MSDWPFFNCPKCKALYHVVKVADLWPTEGDGNVNSRLCGEPLPDREGPYILKYFLLSTTGVTNFVMMTPPECCHSGLANNRGG